MSYNSSIHEILIKIFQKRININFDERQDLRSHSLFDETLQIPIRELVLIVIDIKEKLNYYSEFFINITC